MRISAVFLLIVLLSCQERQESSVAVTQQPIKEVLPPAPKLEEFFADSTRVGRKKHNKIELKRFSVGDSLYVTIQFFSKNRDQWELKNSFDFGNGIDFSSDPQLRDFNNDGMNDMTYIWATAARGANELRRLFVYNYQLDQLVYIKNSDEYPNLHYNKYLNCIDAWSVYGGTMSEFLRLTGDSLVLFASVELYEGLTVRTYDRAGKKTVILRDSTVEGNLARYKNYKPVQEYTEADDLSNY